MPDRLSPVIINATPLISLSLIKQLGLLQHLYGEVLMPAAVQAELLAGGAGRTGVTEIAQATWLKVTSLRDPRRADLLMTDLDRGEAEVIALALEVNARLVVIDERLARRHARRLNLNLTGTLGLLLKAKRQGLLPALQPLIEQLRDGGIWLDEALIAEVLRLAGE